MDNNRTVEAYILQNMPFFRPIVTHIDKKMY